MCPSCHSAGTLSSVGPQALTGHLVKTPQAGMPGFKTTGRKERVLIISPSKPGDIFFLAQRRYSKARGVEPLQCPLQIRLQRFYFLYKNGLNRHTEVGTEASGEIISLPCSGACTKWQQGQAACYSACLTRSE